MGGTRAAGPCRCVTVPSRVTQSSSSPLCVTRRDATLGGDSPTTTPSPPLHRCHRPPQVPVTATPSVPSLVSPSPRSAHACSRLAGGHAGGSRLSPGVPKCPLTATPEWWHRDQPTLGTPRGPSGGHGSPRAAAERRASVTGGGTGGVSPVGPPRGPPRPRWLRQSALAPLPVRNMEGPELLRLWALAALALGVSLATVPDHHVLPELRVPAETGAIFVHELEREPFLEAFSGSEDDDAPVTFRAHLWGHPDLPRWLRLAQRGPGQPGFLYGCPGAPELGMHSIQVLAYNRHTFATASQRLVITVTPTPGTARAPQTPRDGPVVTTGCPHVCPPSLQAGRRRSRPSSWWGTGTWRSCCPRQRGRCSCRPRPGSGSAGTCTWSTSPPPWTAAAASRCPSRAARRGFMSRWAPTAPSRRAWPRPCPRRAAPAVTVASVPWPPATTPSPPTSPSAGATSPW
uniref:Uncharacterized protein n=1 Tax=Geospiza parvula TaxID=87175 RepID=A0A8U8C7L3_GEOPR